MAKDPRKKAPFFAEVWLACDIVNTCSLSVQGAFMKLLAYQIVHGCIPNDTDALAVLCKINPDSFLTLWKKLDCYFPIDVATGTRRNSMMAELQDHSEAIRMTRSRIGARGGAPVKTDNQLVIDGGTNRFPIATPIGSAMDLASNADLSPSDSPPIGGEVSIQASSKSAYQKCARVLRRSYAKLEWEPPEEADIVAASRITGPCYKLIEAVGMSMAADLFVWANLHWRSGAGWVAVFNNRRQIQADMEKRGSKITSGARELSLKELEGIHE